MDRIQPVSLGGTDDVANLRWTCAQCNAARGNDTTWRPAETASDYWPTQDAQ